MLRMMNELKSYLKSFSKKKSNKLVMKQNGEYSITNQIATDFSDLCNDGTVTDPMKVEYLSKISDALNNFIPDYVKQTHYVYYVKSDISSKQGCRTSNTLLGS